MDLSRIILGPVVTEKAERLKGQRTFTLRVAPDATKILVRRALKAFYDVDAASVRIIPVRAKVRSPGGRSPMEKRHRWKKALVTLAERSASLDLASFNV